MSLSTLHDLFVHELKDLFSAEKQLLKALPKMAKAAHSDDLRTAFEEHLEQTQGHADRLEEILTGLDAGTRGPKCAAMEGLIKEGGQMIHEDAEDAVKDAGLIAAAQRVEHYEIAGYGTAVAFARRLGEKKAEKLLAQTLEEEKETDVRLTELAESTINAEAEEPDEEEAHAANGGRRR